MLMRSSGLRETTLIITLIPYANELLLLFIKYFVLSLLEVHFLPVKNPEITD